TAGFAGPCDGAVRSGLLSPAGAVAGVAVGLAAALGRAPNPRAGERAGRHFVPPVAEPPRGTPPGQRFANQWGLHSSAAVARLFAPVHGQRARVPRRGLGPGRQTMPPGGREEPGDSWRTKTPQGGGITM